MHGAGTASLQFDNLRIAMAIAMGIAIAMGFSQWGVGRGKRWRQMHLEMKPRACSGSPTEGTHTENRSLALHQGLQRPKLPWAVRGQIGRGVADGALLLRESTG